VGQLTDRRVRATVVALLLAAIALATALALAAPASATRIGRGFTLEETTIAKTHRAMRKGRITCRQLVRGYMRRIAAYEDAGPRINALILTNPRALRTAARLDRAFRRRSRLSGPLHCVPVLLKDNFDTADLPTTAASRALEGAQPPDDATTVRKLRRAGAVVLAKANLHELAVTGLTVSSLGGQSLNPYDLTRTPGGSSGGTGAGLAANFALLGTGTDTVNSVRSPASANSVVGIRGTAGLVSRDGIVPLGFPSQDAAGPLARTVEDAARFLDVLTGYDPADPITARSVGNVPRTYRRALDRDALRGARLGIFTPFFGTDPALHGQVNAVMGAAHRRLRAAGARLVRVAIPGLTADGLIADLDVQRFEFKAALEAYLRTTRPPRSSLAEILASGLYHPSIDSFLRTANSIENGLEQPEYKDRLVGIHALRDQILKSMVDHDLDALVFPQQKRLVVPIGQPQVDRNGILAALTGFPEISVPGGFSARTRSAPLGVPVGLEIFGRPWSESKLIGYAYAFEQATRFRRPPRSTPPLR
jgi:amidase